MEGSIVYEGGCLCGAVRYRASGKPLWVCHCHCRMCQRQTGAAFSTFVGFPSERIEWTRGKPSLYRSSERVERGFCATCGSTMTFHRDHKSELDVAAGSLDHLESIAPEFHINTENQVPWLKLDDGLPCHLRFPPEGKDRDATL